MQLQKYKQQLWILLAVAYMNFEINMSGKNSIGTVGFDTGFSAGLWPAL